MAASLWLAQVPAACSSRDASAPVEGGTAMDVGSPEGPGEAGSDQETLDAASPARSTHVRFAVWWPYLLESDFCVAPLALTPRNADAASKIDAGAIPWQGPVVAQAASAIDGGVTFSEGGMPGIAFPQVSRYLDLPAGAYLIRVVLAGASDCAVNVLPDQPLPDFPADAFTTVAVVGYLAGDPHVTIESLADDTSASRAEVGLRFVAAVTSGDSLSVGKGVPGSPGFELLFVGVPFGQTGDPSETEAGTVDKNHYLALPPLVDTTLTLTAAGAADAGPIDAGAIDVIGTDAPRLDAAMSDAAGADVGGFDASGPVVSRGVSLAAGSIATLAAVGTTTDPLVRPQLVLCLDTAPAVGGVFADCRVLAPPGD